MTTVLSCSSEFSNFSSTHSFRSGLDSTLEGVLVVSSSKSEGSGSWGVLSRIPTYPNFEISYCFTCMVFVEVTPWRGRRTVFGLVRYGSSTDQGGIDNVDVWFVPEKYV